MNTEPTEPATKVGSSALLAGESEECPKCAELEDACPECARKIHESWHEQGMWWIRAEECHETCPGRLKKKKDNTMESAAEWLCECGERANPVSPEWRWNGRDWEHHHGYPISHCAAARSPANVELSCEAKPDQKSTEGENE